MDVVNEFMILYVGWGDGWVRTVSLYKHEDLSLKSSTYIKALQNGAHPEPQSWRKGSRDKWLLKFLGQLV